MDEKKKSLLIIIIAAIVVIAMIIIGVISGNNSEKTYEQFETAFNGSDPKLVYIGRPTCSYCQLLDPSIKEMEKRYDFSYLYVNTDSMSTKYMNLIMAQLGITSIGTPYLAVVSNGKVVATQNGYADYDVVFKFLQDNKIISNDATLPLTYIDLDEYKQLVASDEKNIIVVGQSTCQYCIKSKLVLNDIADEYKTKINYLNISYLTDEEAVEFKASFAYFGTDDWGTPVTIVVQNGEILGMLEGYNVKQPFVDFFQAQGVL